MDEIEEKEPAIGKKCLIKDCKRIVSGRGLCANCYATAHVLIKEKKTTWEQLAKMGLARLKPREMQPANPFTRAFMAIFKMGK